MGGFDGTRALINVCANLSRNAVRSSDLILAFNAKVEDVVVVEALLEAELHCRRLV